MRKLLVFVTALVLVATACGGGKKDQSSALAGSQESSAPGATATLAPGESPSSGGTTSSTQDASKTSAPDAGSGGTGGTSGDGSGGGTSGGGSGGGGTTKQNEPTKTTAPGGVSQPKAGQYVYDLDGKATDPTNPAGGQQDYPDDAEVTHDVTNQGNVSTDEQTSSEGSGITTTKTRFEKDKVLFLSIDVNTPLGEFKCNFDPPLLITHIPIRAETIPTQNFSGSGNACNGKLDIQIVKQESAKDATGKAWPTWQVKVHTEVASPQFSSTQNETRWFSPDLGVEIRSDGSSNGWFKADPNLPAKTNFSATTKTALKKHP